MIKIKKKRKEKAIITKIKIAREKKGLFFSHGSYYHVAIYLNNKKIVKNILFYISNVLEIYNFDSKCCSESNLFVLLVLFDR